MGESHGGKEDTHTPKRDWIRAAVDRYERPLPSYTARIIGDADRARDVVQDAFLRLWRRDEAEPDDHLAQWLFTVCRNRALDVVRKERRMKPITETDARSRPSGDPPPASTTPTGTAPRSSSSHESPGSFSRRRRRLPRAPDSHGQPRNRNRPAQMDGPVLSRRVDGRSPAR
jgi:RNA polymerase sigma factor (sigma-70 family)